MKRILFCLGLFILLVSNNSIQAQSVLDAEDDNNLENFYAKTLTKEKRAMPYAYLRENDVVWETVIWRTIDFREKFNQFMYFPTDPTKNTQGRINLVNCIMKALENGDFEVYDNDEFKGAPLDYDQLMGTLNRETTIHVPVYDEYGDELDGYDTIVREEFDPADVYSCELKEHWYIDKQDTRQKVRIVGLALVYNYCRDRDGDRECSPVRLFWIPMNDMRVRNVLVTANSYDENNNNAERTYDDVFITRYFDSFVTRETNRFNRSIGSYLTGTDAILESQYVEDKIFNIESDMWEY